MQKRGKLRRGVAIVGAGMSKFAMFKDKDSKDLFTEAFREMLSSVDKGVDPADIDALYVGNFSNDYFFPAVPLGTHYLGHHRTRSEAGHEDGGLLRFERPGL